MTHETPRLSIEAMNDLRAIVKEEIPPPMTDEEIEDMGWRLLRFFSILVTPEPRPNRITVSDRDYKALSFLHSEILNSRSPSVRDLCVAMGLRSSRSGFRLLKKYLAMGWVWRDEKGNLQMVEW